MVLGTSRSGTTQTVSTILVQVAARVTCGFGWTARAQPSMRTCLRSLPSTPAQAWATCTEWTIGAEIPYDSNGVIKLVIIDPGVDRNWQDNKFTMDLRTLKAGVLPAPAAIRSR